MKGPLLAALLALPAPALACQGPQFEVATFLSRLTEAQADAPFAARVRVTGADLSMGEAFPLYAVEIVEMLRGEAPDALRVAAAGHSCARRTEVDMGSEWIVAGTVTDGVIGTAWNLWETELAPPLEATD